MKFKLTDRETKDLLTIVNFAAGILGYTNDYMDEPQIATRARIWQKIEEKMLQQAHAAGREDIVEKGEFGIHIHNTIFESNMEIGGVYEDLVVHKDLANKLAWRDFHETHSEEEIQNMAEESGGYLGVALHPFEEKYWDEFEKHAYKRLRIDTESKK